MALLLLASYAQEFPVFRCAPSTPCLTPDTHGYRRSHAEHDHDAVESKDWTHAGGINEVLQRLVDSKVDARRANGEDDDNFTRDLLVELALQYKFQDGCHLLQGSSPSRMRSKCCTH